MKGKEEGGIQVKEIGEEKWIGEVTQQVLKGESLDRRGRLVTPFPMSLNRGETYGETK